MAVASNVDIRKSKLFSNIINKVSEVTAGGPVKQSIGNSIKTSLTNKAEAIDAINKKTAHSNTMSFKYDKNKSKAAIEEMSAKRASSDLEKGAGTVRGVMEQHLGSQAVNQYNDAVTNASNAMYEENIEALSSVMSKDDFKNMAYVKYTGLQDDKVTADNIIELMKNDDFATNAKNKMEHNKRKIGKSLRRQDKVISPIAQGMANISETGDIASGAKQIGVGVARAAVPAVAVGGAAYTIHGMNEKKKEREMYGY